MNGHQHHLVAVLIVAVDVADQGDLLEISLQGGVHPLLVAVVFDVIHQLTQVLQPVLGVLVALGGLLFQHPLIAGQLDQLAGEEIQGAGFQRVAELLVHLVEAEQRHHGPGQPGILIGPADDVQHADPLLGGQLGDGLDGGGADLAGGFIDDPTQPDVVLGVGHNGHIGVDVLNLFAVVKPLPAHNLVGDARPGEVVFDGGRLGVHPVKDRVVGQMPPGPQVLADDVCNVHGLVGLVLSPIDMNLFPLAVVGPELLALSLGVVADHTVGRVEDIGGGAVVLLQPDGPGAGVIFLKVEDVLNGGAPEPVDALVVVAHHADVLLRPGQQAHQLELCHAGILVLVHQQIAVTLLVIMAHLGVLPQKNHGLVNQIVEIKGARIFQLLFVLGVDPGGQRTLGAAGVGLGCFGGADQLVLPAAELIQRRLDGEKLVVYIQLFVDALHHPLGVVGVVDGKTPGPAQFLGISAQKPHTGRVEGGGKHLLPCLLSQHPAQATAQLPGGFVGEGDGHDVPAADRASAEHPLQPGGGLGFIIHRRPQRADVLGRHLPGGLPAAVGAAEPDQVGDPVDQHGGFAAARPRQDQEGALGGKDRPPLHLVQTAELLLDVCIPEGTKFCSQVCCHSVYPFLFVNQITVYHILAVFHRALAQKSPPRAGRAGAD